MDVCCGPDGKTTSSVNTAVSPGSVGERALLFILSQGLCNFMSSSYQSLRPNFSLCRP